jgi:mono/diheme cytochrome c family protein
VINSRGGIAADVLAALLAVVAPAVRPAPILNTVQSDYLENCGGCHGIQGSSFPAHVPQLRGRIGYFLCTADSRAYLLSLPNVALSSMDDERLAAVMNFVVFDLGGASTDTASRRFTRQEVARGRKHPLMGASLASARATIVRQIEERCRVRSELLRF